MYQKMNGSRSGTHQDRVTVVINLHPNRQSSQMYPSKKKVLFLTCLEVFEPSDQISTLGPIGTHRSLGIFQRVPLRHKIYKPYHTQSQSRLEFC
jgi:hypothetical protein